MEQNKDFDFICSLKYFQNKSTISQINLLTQTFYIKYEDQKLINMIKSNSRNLNKLSNFTPKLIEFEYEKEPSIFLDIIPAGSLADLIYFNEKDISSHFIKEFNDIKMMTIYFLVHISEVLIKNNLTHTNFTPEHILFTSDKKIIIGGIEYIQSLDSNSFFYDNTPFSIYIAPEVIKGNPVPESFSYSLSLLIYSIITLSFIHKIPKNCPKNMDKTLFSFLMSCCDPDPNKRPKVTEIKHEIAKTYKNFANLKFDQVYSNSDIYGTKDNFIDLIEMQYPISFYIVGSTFLDGNVFDMTSKEAISFLEISKNYFFENIQCKNDAINNYFQKKNSIYITDIDQQIEKIKKNQKNLPNISFYNEDPSMINDQINISIYNTNLTPIDENNFPNYGFYGIQAINDSLESEKRLSCPLDELFNSQFPDFSVEKQDLNMYQSVANAKLACREKCDTSITHLQKRNVNFHSFTQIGALQVATRMFSELSPDINYDIVLNTGKGLHSTNGNKAPKNSNLDGNESILCSTLSTAIENFTGKQPSIGENQGTLTTKIINVEKEKNEGDYYF